MLKDDQAVSPPVTAAGRRNWIIGGSLLVASVVVSAAIQPGAFIAFGGDLIGTCLFAVGVLVLTFGADSIVARRALGATALAVLAAWAVVGSVVRLFTTNVPIDNLLAFSYIESFIRFAVAAIAVSQIARVGVVPRPWSLAPGWVLAAVAATWFLQLALGGVVKDSQSALTVLISLDVLVRTGGTVLLGVIAIILGFGLTPRRYFD